MQAPPLLVSFNNLKDYSEALSKKALGKYGNKIEDLAKNELPPIVSRRCLATLFGVNQMLITSMIDNTDNYYRVFFIKKGKKKRKIEAPRVGLKIIQKWIAEHLAKAIKLHECVHGFVPNRSYITAAKMHLKAQWVYSIDIKDFFQSTPIEKVENAFKALGYPDYGAEIASKLCCYQGHLAQGSPASPTLSNYIFANLDEEIGKKAKELNVIYTRYADDMVFSGRDEFPKKIKEVKKLIRENGWKISSKKERLSKSPNRREVHGLLVHGNFVRLTKGYRNKIRAFKHLMEKEKIKKTDIPRIKGHIGLANYIDTHKN